MVIRAVPWMTSARKTGTPVARDMASAPVMMIEKKIADGTPDEVCANQDVIDAYLGVSHD